MVEKAVQGINLTFPTERAALRVKASCCMAFVWGVDSRKNMQPASVEKLEQGSFHAWFAADLPLRTLPVSSYMFCLTA